MRQKNILQPIFILAVFLCVTYSLFVIISFSAAKTSVDINYLQHSDTDIVRSQSSDSALNLPAEVNPDQVKPANQNSDEVKEVHKHIPPHYEKDSLRTVDTTNRDNLIEVKPDNIK